MIKVFECNPDDLDICTDLCIVLYTTETSWSPEAHWDNGFVRVSDMLLLYPCWEEGKFVFSFQVEVDGISVLQVGDSMIHTSMDDCIRAAAAYLRIRLNEVRAEWQERFDGDMAAWQAYEKALTDAIPLVEAMAGNWKQYYTHKVWEVESE